MPEPMGSPPAAPRSTRPTLSRQIRDGLLRRIVSGELGEGDRLIETKIAGEFGTSQAPVREALRQLEGLGLIESQPRHGSRVLPFAEQTIREAYIVRAALEETATRLAMLAGTLPFDLLGEAVEEMYRCARGDDVHGIGLASARFHRHVMQAGGNRLLTRAWEALQIEARTAIALMVTGPELVRVAGEHRELLDVMRAGDVEAACRHARDHQWAYADTPHDPYGTPRPQARDA
ncbi:GntR family transcriptional regulator [Nonomuraea phyllanthi]|uniref:GntR family transcriptional regulator n=1 Tax=Nonomuraea phyllanthi TaxID=2219224 RepID=UPI00186B43D2|nr:GntR family transcriptional regulator [Nonomuraea phyllanthi]